MNTTPVYFTGIDIGSTASKTVVLKEGKVVQTGTHKELTSMSGVYRQMWDAYTDAFRWELNVGNK